MKIANSYGNVPLSEICTSEWNHNWSKRKIGEKREEREKVMIKEETSFK